MGRLLVAVWRTPHSNELVKTPACAEPQNATQRCQFACKKAFRFREQAHARKHYSWRFLTARLKCKCCVWIPQIPHNATGEAPPAAAAYGGNGNIARTSERVPHSCIIYICLLVGDLCVRDQVYINGKKIVLERCIYGHCVEMMGRFSVGDTIKRNMLYVARRYLCVLRSECLVFLRANIYSRM